MSERDPIKFLRESAQCLDQCLLRAFGAGMMDQAIEDGCAIDPWGSLSDFRRAFGLPPTMSAEDYAKCGGDVYPPSGPMPNVQHSLEDGSVDGPPSAEDVAEIAEERVARLESAAESAQENLDMAMALAERNRIELDRLRSLAAPFMEWRDWQDDLDDNSDIEFDTLNEEHAHMLAALKAIGTKPDLQTPDASTSTSESTSTHPESGDGLLTGLPSSEVTHPGSIHSEEKS